MKISSFAASVALTLLVGSGAAFAQATTTPAAPSAPAATTTPTAATTDKKAIAAECSAEADKKGLHGKARKTFRSQCKREKSK
jgi:hypothetical protein